MKFAIPSILLTVALLYKIHRNGRTEDTFPAQPNQPLTPPIGWGKGIAILFFVGLVLAFVLMPNYLDW